MSPSGLYLKLSHQVRRLSNTMVKYDGDARGQPGSDQLGQHLPQRCWYNMLGEAAQQTGQLYEDFSISAFLHPASAELSSF